MRCPLTCACLQNQAEEGVKVSVLIWDDRTSVNMAGLTSGMLHTHDEETHNFFQGTSVSVGKSLRCAFGTLPGACCSSTAAYLTSTPAVLRARVQGSAMAEPLRHLLPTHAI